jgi:hypothetical protein
VFPEGFDELFFACAYPRGEWAINPARIIRVHDEDSGDVVLKPNRRVATEASTDEGGRLTDRRLQRPDARHPQRRETTVPDACAVVAVVHPIRAD